MDDGIDQPIPTVPKPDELLALHDVTAELFTTLRRWFAVPASVALDLRDIDSAVGELGDPLMIAALAMRKLQALRLLSTPGVMTTTDVVITIVQDLDRALVQAPNMHLKLQAAATDWDAAFAELDLAGDAVDRDGDGPDGASADPATLDGPAELGGLAAADGLPALEAIAPFDASDASDDIDDLDAELSAFEVERFNDQELAALDHPSRHPGPPVPSDPQQADPETERFRMLHGKLHDAVFAVIEISENEIRYLI